VKLNLPEGDPADQAGHPSVCQNGAFETAYGSSFQQADNSGLKCCHTSQETEARDTQWMKLNLPQRDPADQAAVKVKVIMHTKTLE